METTQVIDWLKQKIAELTELPVNEINEDEKFSNLGITSSQLTAMTAELNNATGKNFLPTLFYSHPTLERIREHLDQKTAKRASKQSKTQLNEPVAVVGMACHFPKGNGLEAFWELIKNGKEAISEVPADRWDADAYFDSDPKAEGKTNVKRGGFITDFNAFDPFFFDISPIEAREMSAEQKLALHTTWQAFSHANIPISTLKGSKTGVFVGNIWNNHHLSRTKKNSPIKQHSATGYSSNIIANRISYTFGFQGPSMVVDTACSTSLVTLHLACQSLKEGSSDIALAGGVNLLSEPETFVEMTKFGGLCEDGRCKTFDKEANGYVRGEGIGLVVLKRLSQALEDGDQIHGVIRGSAINNDGASNGMTAPNVEAQKDVLEMACQNADIQPADLHYVEAHGTGTKLGDPIEAEALGAVIGQQKTNEKLYVGSVKTNIGHLEGAAGIAGVIKVLLAMKHRHIPKHLNFNNPNPYIPFDALNLEVQKNDFCWPVKDTETFKAGVSSFGWGGTNAHVILEAYQPEDSALFTFSADTKEALWERLKEAQKTIQQTDKEIALPNVAGSFAAKHSNASHRVAFVASSLMEADSLLLDIMTTEGHDAYQHISKKPKVAYVFPPFGTQYTGMAVQLYKTQKEFREHFDLIAQLIKPHLGVDLKEKLFTFSDEEPLYLKVASGLQFGIQLSLAYALKNWGVRPDAVMGNSMFEVTAAHIAGFYSIETAAQYMAGVVNGLAASEGLGSLVVAQTTERQLKPFINSIKSLEIAGYNSKQNIILAGTYEDLELFVSEASSKGIKLAKVNFEVPTHSALMPQVYATTLKETCKGASTAGENQIPMYSTPLAKEITKEDLKLDYWVTNQHDKIYFRQAAEVMLKDGIDTFVELHVHPTVAFPLKEVLKDNKAEATVITALKRGEDDNVRMQSLLESLFLAGVDIDWTKVFEAKGIIADNSTPVVLPISAKTPDALKRFAEAYQKRLQDNKENAYALGATASLGQSELEYKAAFTAYNAEELSTEIQQFLDQEIEEKPKVKGKTVFIFPGQGAQWLGMGKTLYEKEAAFRQAIDECEVAYSNYTDWSLKAQLFASEGNSRLNEIDVIQPMITAVQIALARLWEAYGIHADGVAGHSMGEVAAAYIAGAINLNEAASIICTRSQLMKRTSGQGAMAVTELSVDKAEAICAQYPGKISVAVSNSPTSTVIAGDPQIIEKIVDELDEEGLFARQVKVDVASHSVQMDPLKADLKEALQNVQPAQARLDIFSTVRAEKTEGSVLDADYWVSNLRQPVRFNETLQLLLEEEYTTFIEVSPHPVLSNAIKEVAELAGKEEDIAVAISTLREKDEWLVFRKQIGLLSTYGVAPDWNAIYPAFTNFVSLPEYPWNKEVYELEEGKKQEETTTVVEEHHLLGNFFDLAGSEAYTWQSQATLEKLQKTHPGLTHYPLQYLADLLDAAIEELEQQQLFYPADFNYNQLLDVSADQAYLLQTCLKEAGENYSFEFFVSSELTAKKKKWTRIANGLLKPGGIKQEVKAAIESPKTEKPKTEQRQVQAEPPVKEFETVQPKAVTTSAFAQQLQIESDPKERLKLLQEFVKEQTSVISKAPVNQITLNASFKNFGIDSLMAVQLRNLIQEKLGIKVAVTQFWSNPTIKEYAKFLDKKLAQNPASEKATFVPSKLKKKALPESKSVDMQSEISAMSFDDLNQALDEELNNLNLN